MLACMCGRYTNTSGPEELNERFRVPIAGVAGTHRFNIAPTEEVLAIEEHRFPRLDFLYWRDGEPDLGSIEDLVTHRAPLAQVDDAFEKMVSRTERVWMSVVHP